jgi:Tfp pilus assembly protein PilF
VTDKIHDNRLLLFICLFLAVVTFAVFWQVTNNGFITFDDPEYVTENHHVRNGLTVDGVVWAFTSVHTFNWHPLTSLSHMMDVQLFGLKPGGHHLINLIFHIANTLLLFLIFKRTTGVMWQSAFVAALFALHPLHVESVAWISERKDVLSTLFLFLTIFCYVRYVEDPKVGRYLPVILFFALGLMAKQMLVTLPFILLLLDYWPLGRLDIRKSAIAGRLDEPGTKRRADKKKKHQKVIVKNEVQIQKAPTSVYKWPLLISLVKEKLPLFGMAAAASVVVLIVQSRTGVVKSIEQYSLQARIENTLVSYVAYIGKMIWPANMAIFYPHPGDTLAVWQVAGAGLLIVCITVLLLFVVKKPYLIVGWLWYLGTLVPVIGLVQVGLQSMADRYTYVPYIGLFIMIAWGVPDLLAKWPYRRNALVFLASAYLSILIIVTWLQVQYWRDDIALYEHAVKVTSNNYWAHYNLGLALAHTGNLDQANSHFLEAIRIKPSDAKTNLNLGVNAAMRGNHDLAMTYFYKALQAKPDYADAHKNLGIALMQKGKLDDAVSRLREASKILPSDPEIPYLLGRVSAKQGNPDEAMKYFTRALEIKPDYAEAHNNLGIVLARKGKVSEAVAHFREALWIRPDYKEAYNNLQVALAQQTKTQ